jgi:hypothetical protein
MTAPQVTRLLRVSELLSSEKAHGGNENVSSVLLGLLSVPRPTTDKTTSLMGATLVFEDATGSLPVIVTGIRDWDSETFERFTKMQLPVAISSWNLLTLVHSSKGESRLCLEINASSGLRDGRSLSRHYDFHIPSKDIEALKPFAVSHPRTTLAPSLDSLPVRLTAKSELFFYGGSRKGFMVKADCYFPSTQASMTSPTSYKLIAYILFNQGGDSYV